MKNFNFRKLFLFGLVASSLCIISCSDDEEPLAAPEASFTSTVDGKTVTFTNTTVGEEVTYSWDFVDGNTSTEESPVYTYEANGNYIVKLVATNEGGEDDTESVLEINNIKIDGDVSDWADVSALSFTGEGAIQEVKMENLSNQTLYFYIKGTSETTSFLDLWINLDYSATVSGESDTTGFFTGVYPESNLGWDMLFEGFFGSADGRALNIELDEGSTGMYILNMYPEDEDDLFSNNNAWGVWNQSSLGSQITFSEMVTSGDVVEYEFSIDLQSMPSSLIPETGDEILFFIDEWVNSPTTSEGWWASFTSHYPAGQSTEGATAASYTLK